MFGRSWAFCAAFFLAGLIFHCTGSAAAAQDSAWRVSRASGDIWVTASGAQPAALGNASVLNPGDTIRTGRNGRALLVRGEETMLISANSVVGIPEATTAGLSTTIIQQAGSVLLEVEKRNVQHFEVETPYLAAVVKGTKFRVTVVNGGSEVEVVRGQVQVTDYKTGQNALVNPEQVAKVSVQGPSGLSLSGPGLRSAILPGTPRGAPVAPIVVPDGGLAAPVNAQNSEQVRKVVLEFQTTSDSASSDGWADGFVTWGKSVIGLNGQKKRDEAMTLMLAFPAFVGFSVAIGAGVLRRRQKQKPRDR